MNLTKLRSKPGMSNAYKKKFADGSKRVGPYAGPNNTYPIPDISHARSALRLASHASNPSSIKSKVYRKYPSLRKAKNGMNVRYAKTDAQRKMGLLAGYNGFTFPDGGEHQFTMNPLGTSIPYPVHYVGMNGNTVVDSGVAMPGNNFKVRGKKVIETPLYQEGGALEGYELPFATISGQGQGRKAGAPQLWSPVTSTLRDIPQVNNPLLNYKAVYDRNATDDSVIPNLVDPNNPVNTQTLPQQDGELGVLDDTNRLKWYDFPIASTAYNLAMGLFDKTKEHEQNNLNAPRSLSILNSLQYTPNYRPIRLLQNRLESNIRDSSGNASSYIANIQNAEANLTNQMYDEDRAAQQLNNQYKSTYANALSQEGQVRAEERKRIIDRNQMHRAARFAHIREALATADAFAAKQREFKQADNDNIVKLQSMKAQYPDMDFSWVKKAFPQYAYIFND